jgi:homogentisate 1,2-dioxygenase
MNKPQKPHKHAECIIAWANGAEIEYRRELSDAWRTVDDPTWYLYMQYRIKPQPVIKKMYMHYDSIKRMVSEGNYDRLDVLQQMYSDNNAMSDHIEFTFTDNELTSVEIKKT